MSTVAQAHAWNQAHPERHRQLSREYRARYPDTSQRWHRQLRRKALEALGGKCLKCGFEDWRALEIDHVNNDGPKDRKEKKRSRNGMLNDIIKNGAQGKYQLLCANCHQIKSYEEIWKFTPGRSPYLP